MYCMSAADKGFIQIKFFTTVLVSVFQMKEKGRLITWKDKKNMKSSVFQFHNHSKQSLGTECDHTGKVTTLKRVLFHNTTVVFSDHILNLCTNNQKFITLINGFKIQHACYILTMSAVILPNTTQKSLHKTECGNSLSLFDMYSTENSAMTKYVLHHQLHWFL